MRRRLWDAAVRPSARLNETHQRDATLLATLNLVFFILAVAVLFINPVLDWFRGEGFVFPVIYTLTPIPMIALGYALSRSRLYMVGAYVTILVPIAVVAGVFVAEDIAIDATGAVILNFMTLSIILSGLLLNAAGTLITGSAVIATIVMIYLSMQALPGSSFPAHLVMFVVITTVIVAVVNRIRELNLRRLESTQATLKEREQELTRLNATLEQRVIDRTRQLKQARDDALAAQRIANENSRLKSEFLSTMSHELRTPMNAIEGFSGIILKRMAGVDYNDKAERYLKKIQANSRRLLGLINDFLDLSRIESGRLELASLPMCPRDMAQEWYASLSVLAEKKGLGFEVIVDPALPETMYGDEESISKIVINLLGNAIKFTEGGGVTLALQCSGNQMAIRVSDTGMGIPPHARDFIFDEFRQVDQSSKRQHGGTGLGLAIVQKLTRAMGGTVSVESEVGVGSTFTVLLPIEVEQQIA
ncbi:MAG: sensor histidine kinase [Chloroflexota bacterium]